MRRKRFEGEGEIASRLETPRRRFLQAPIDDPHQSGRDVAVVIRNVGRVLLEDGRDRVNRRGAPKRALSSEHLVQHGTERKDVCAMIDELPAQLLRCHVAHRAEQHAWLRPDRRCRDIARSRNRGHLHEFREAEVQNFHATAGSDKHVLRFQIPMNNSLLMSRGQTMRDLNRVFHGLANWDGASVETLPQRFAFEQLRDNVRCTLMPADVVYGENVGMVQRRCRTRLLLEPLEPLWVGRETRRQNLNGYVASETRVASFVDLSHSAGPNGRKDFIRAKANAGMQRHLLKLVGLYRPDRESGLFSSHQQSRSFPAGAMVATLRKMPTKTITRQDLYL